MHRLTNIRNDFFGYEDEGKHSKNVPNHKFTHEIEIINPLSVKYERYWKMIKRRCVEGYWVDGKWMPGNLYFYVNLCKIQLNENKYSKTKVEGRPFLRDLEWEKAYVYAEARGFSGFDEDPDTTCAWVVDEINKLPREEKETWKIDYDVPKECLKPNGELKAFVNPRHYLKRVHAKNYGKPLYQNEAKNVIDIECRGGGKSYWAANGMILHNFLMDGATNYDEYLRALKSKKKMMSQTLVGAIDSGYSKDLLDKVQLSMDNLIGEQTFQGEIYPSPLMKLTAGSWHSGLQVKKARLQKKTRGQWKTIGSGSSIYHRSFKDNEHAGNGTRPSLTCLEEVGFFSLLKETLGAMKDTTYNGSNKFGTIYMFGTGGDMEGGSSDAAMEVFNDPSAFDCLSFNDSWEDTGEIGYFVPYEMGLNDMKDDEGNTNWDAAMRSVDKKRDKLTKGKSKKPLYDEMQNNPRMPSEAFLTINSNIFPVGELKEHLGWLRSHQTDAFVKGQNGTLDFVMDEGAKEPRLKWNIDLKNQLTPTWFKMNKIDDTTGCIQIWEHPVVGPDGTPPFGLYVAGTDPYDQDQAPSTASLGSTFIYKTFHTQEGLYEWPVAEYTARPATAAEHHENVRKLLLYYNARDLYENERNTMKMHFEHKFSLYLLTKTPTMLKATEGSKVERGYGIHMPTQVKDEIEIYTRDWLLQKNSNGKLNLHNIYSIPLIQELIYYNKEGNFDRVIAFMLTITNRLNNYHLKVQEVKKEQQQQDPWFARAANGGFFKN